MSRNDWFEDFLRARVSREATGFDPESAWTRLQQRRRERRRRRIFFLFFLLAGVTGGISIWQWQPHTVSRYTDSPKSGGLGEMAVEAKPSGNYANKNGTTIGAAEHAPLPHHLETPVPRRETAFTARYAEIPVSYAHELLPPEQKWHAWTGIAPIAGESDDTVFSDDNSTRQKAEASDQAVAPIPVFDPVSTLAPQPFDHRATPQFCRISDIAFKGRRPGFPKWYLGVDIGYGLQFASRSGSDTPWLNRRSEEEKTLDMFSLGLTLRRHLSRRWFVQGGIAYSRLTDRRTVVSETTVTQIMPNQLVQIIIAADGTEEKVFSDAPVTTVTRTEGVQYNRLDRLELPVLAGLSLFPERNWGLGLSAGVVPTLAGRLDGAVADSGTGATLSLNDAGYRRSGLLSGLLHVELSARFQAGVLGLSLQGRSDLLNTTKTGAGFSEKRTSAGVALSYRHVIGRR